jgi:hypothetical protein
MSNTPEEQSVNVRFTWPSDVHKKIKSHQRKISANMDQDATMEQAVIDFVRKAKVQKA